MPNFLELFRRKDLAFPEWQGILRDFERGFLYEYYSLPASWETLKLFLDTGEPQKGYVDLCLKWLPVAQKIKPILSAEAHRLWLKERNSKKRDTEYCGSSSEASTQIDVLNAFTTILKSPAAPPALLIDHQLRDLYWQLPDTRLPDGFNPIHDFWWRGINLGSNQNPKIFAIRMLQESYVPHPLRQGIWINDGSGHPLPHQAPEVRCRKGFFRSEGYYDILINMGFLYWFNIEVKAYT